MEKRQTLGRGSNWDTDELLLLLFLTDFVPSKSVVPSTSREEKTLLDLQSALSKRVSAPFPLNPSLSLISDNFWRLRTLRSLGTHMGED